jgi:ABC-2 type transport system permease protein
MILTLLRIGWINVRRDRVVQAMMFLLPIMFFSIFALVFSNQRDTTPKVSVAVVDEDQSDYSRKLVKGLTNEGSLRVRTTRADNGTGPALDRAGAEKAVRDGVVPVAIVLPKGIGAGHQLWGGAENGPAVELLADVSDPVAPQMVQGILKEVSFTAAPEALAAEGIDRFRQYAGPLTPAQEASVSQWMTTLKNPSLASSSSDTGARQPSQVGLAVKVVNVLQPPGKSDTSMVSFYAAGIGVMFLLFSCSGAGGALLEEEESGTLGRLIGSRLGMGGILLGKWIFVMLMGMLQLTVMFTWGALVFHLPLLTHLPGFVVMTVATAAAAAAFGLVLATISRSRQQLSGIATILILAMSAIGGSMFPRFLMSESMQKVGLITFNAWALDGYIKVFWRDARVIELGPQVLVLASLTVVFLFAARRFARRWEAL